LTAALLCLLLLLSGALLGCLFGCSLLRLLGCPLLCDPLLFGSPAGFFLSALSFTSGSCLLFPPASFCSLGCPLLCDPGLFCLAPGRLLPALGFPGCGCLLGSASLFGDSSFSLLLVVAAHRWGSIVHLVFTAWAV
jgi:hypothetical protein